MSLVAMVAPSIVPPLMSAVVTVPKSAQVLEAAVQSLPKLKLEPSSALILSNATLPTLVILPSLTLKLLQVTPAALKSASFSVKFPELPPVAAVVATVNVSSLSSQPIKAFVKSPLSITIPQSLVLSPVVLLFNSIKLSRITVFVDEITSPVTSKPPVI